MPCPVFCVTTQLTAGEGKDVDITATATQLPRCRPDVPTYLKGFPSSIKLYMASSQMLFTQPVTFVSSYVLSFKWLSMHCSNSSGNQHPRNARTMT